MLLLIEMKLFYECRTSVIFPALHVLLTRREMYGNACRTLLSQHLLIKALFD